MESCSGLLAEVPGVYEKEDALGIGVFQEAVHGSDRGEVLPERWPICTRRGGGRS